MRIYSMAAAFGMFVALSVSLANAQEPVKDLAGKASAELRLLTSFQTLERATSYLNHFLVYAIEAERGGWGARRLTKEYEALSFNSYVIHRASTDVQVDIGRENSNIIKSKVATEDELKSAEAIIGNLNALVALASQIADMIEDGKLDAAALLYREKGQLAHENALRAAQSSVGTVQKRLGKTLLNIRIAK